MGRGIGQRVVLGGHGPDGARRVAWRLVSAGALVLLIGTVGGCLTVFDRNNSNIDDDASQQTPDDDVASRGDSADFDLGPDARTPWDSTDTPDFLAGDIDVVSSDLLGPDVQVECTQDQDCDDGIDCTQDLCNQQGVCGNLPNDAACGAPSACVSFTCLPAIGCQEVQSAGVCDDGDPCTSGDVCSGGVCQGTPGWTAQCNYAQAPNVGTCQPGVLSETTKAEALAVVNEFRVLSGLEPVPYLSEGDVQTQAAALMMAANASLSHTPPNSWFCWTQNGYDGANSGNLHIMGSSAPTDAFHPIEALSGFLIDDGVPSLGHRRWVLDPFLPGISYGSVHGTALEATSYPYVSASALKVIYSYDAEIDDTALEYVAYPVNDYPSNYFQNDWYMSFSALVDPTDRWSNMNVSFASATITVTGPNNTNMAVSAVSWNNDGMGVPNHLQWKVAGVQDLVKYTVRIQNVKNGASTLNYEYWFRLE